MKLLLASLVVVNALLFGVKHATPARMPENARVVCSVFGRYCEQALRVSWCESRWQTRARNGQYLGLFQMGRPERSQYGDGRDAWSQSIAAASYFIASGRDWSPWECKP